ncbi:hypothetical protein JCM4914_45910 [Streptomyces platensis subsp. malvinus]
MARAPSGSAPLPSPYPLPFRLPDHPWGHSFIRGSVHGSGPRPIGRVPDRARAVADLMQSDGGVPPHIARASDHSDLGERN